MDNGGGRNPQAPETAVQLNYGLQSVRETALNFRRGPKAAAVGVGVGVAVAAAAHKLWSLQMWGFSNACTSAHQSHNAPSSPNRCRLPMSVRKGGEEQGITSHPLSADQGSVPQGGATGKGVSKPGCNVWRRDEGKKITFPNYLLQHDPKALNKKQAPLALGKDVSIQMQTGIFQWPTYSKVKVFFPFQLHLLPKWCKTFSAKFALIKHLPLERSVRLYSFTFSHYTPQQITPQSRLVNDKRVACHPKLN